jgi:hypothetical protein
MVINIDLNKVKVLDELEAEQDKLILYTLKDNSLKSAIKENQKIEKQIASRYSSKDDQLLFSFMPTQLTRVSPFFPMNRRDSKNRPYTELKWSSSWGDIEIKGKKLSIYDETILLAILHLVKKSKSSDVYTTPYELCKIMGVKRQQNSYKTIWDSIERLTGTLIKLSIDGKPRLINTILTGGAIVENEEKKGNKSLLICLNKFFMTTYVKGMITNINLQFRLKLKGDFSKALYRFLASQRGTEYSCHLITLAKVINVDMKLENRRIKARIKDGLSELRRNGFLSRWMIKKDTEMVYIWKKSKYIK